MGGCGERVLGRGRRSEEVVMRRVWCWREGEGAGIDSGNEDCGGGGKGE